MGHLLSRENELPFHCSLPVAIYCHATKAPNNKIQKYKSIHDKIKNIAQIIAIDFRDGNGLRGVRMVSLQE